MLQLVSPAAPNPAPPSGKLAKYTRRALRHRGLNRRYRASQTGHPLRRRRSRRQDHPGRARHRKRRCGELLLPQDLAGGSRAARRHHRRVAADGSSLFGLTIESGSSAITCSKLANLALARGEARRIAAIIVKPPELRKSECVSGEPRDHGGLGAPQRGERSELTIDSYARISIFGRGVEICSRRR